ncbi:MAG TPA: hypothetical protein VNH11_36265 [Pirellulales bacterium]|nr:hypothetical protein [Pirellulales bacterium]
MPTHSVAEAQKLWRQGFATYPLDGCHPSSCSLWQRAAKVPAARSSAAARRRGDTRVAWARSKRLSSRSSERATVGKCAARGASEGGRFVSGGTRPGGTRVAWRGANGFPLAPAKGPRSASNTAFASTAKPSSNFELAVWARRNVPASAYLPSSSGLPCYGTLADRLTAGRMSPREAAQLCVTIAEALQHAHQAGVIHRDLKPSNI